MPHHLGMREFEWFDVVQKFDIKDHFRIRRAAIPKQLIVSPVTSITAVEASHIDTWEASRNLGPSKPLYRQLYKFRVQHAADKMQSAKLSATAKSIYQSYSLHSQTALEGLGLDSTSKKVRKVRF